MLVLLISLVASQAPIAVFADLTTQWIWQSAIRVHDTLYIEGGEEWTKPNASADTSVFGFSSPAIIDLTNPWTNSSVTLYYGGEPLNVRQPSLFYDPTNSQVYRWGGWPYHDYGNQTTFYQFAVTETATINWTPASAPSANGLGQDSSALFGAAGAATQSTFYALGGANMSTDYASQGLVEYDFSSGQWTNSSSADATASGYLVQGKSHFISNFGSSGFLAYLGGDAIPTQLYQNSPELVGFESGKYLADMSNITLYDVATKAWFHQSTTGDIPPPRSEFCSAATAAEDNSTFEVFVYGGSTNTSWDWANPSDTGYLNVYTLSFPGFRWFKSNDSTPVRRCAHSCEIIGSTANNGSSQMISVGGRLNGVHDGLGQAQDPWPNGIGIFNLSSFTWADYYSPAQGPYNPPSVVKDYYDNNYVKPVFADPVLAQAFAFTPPPSSNSSTTSASSPSSTSSPSGASSSSSGGTSHTGAIVGGVVGGVGALILIGAIIFFMRWRKRRTPKHPSNHDTASSPHMSYYTNSSFSPVEKDVPEHDQQLRPLSELQGQSTSPRQLPSELQSQNSSRRPPSSELHTGSQNSSSPRQGLNELPGQNTFSPQQPPSTTIQRKAVPSRYAGEGSWMPELPGR